MRIAVFIKSTTFHEGYGGLETQSKALCEGLVSRGHDILVFSPQRELKFETKYLNGVKYHFIPCVFRLAKFGKNNWYYRSFFEFCHFHEEQAFDLVVSQSSAGIGVIENKSKLKVPIVSISHGTIIGELRTRFQTGFSPGEILQLAKDTIFSLNVFFGRQRRFIHGSDFVVAVSSAVKKALINETFIDKDKIYVVNNGIDPDKFNQSEQNNVSMPDIAKNSVLYVGQVTRSKGLETLFRLAQEPDFGGTSFHIVGDGDFLSELQGEVKLAGISGRFIFHGKLPYEQVLTFFQSPNMSLFVFPTKRYEGLPMVLVEAMFSGLPVVAYGVGGVSDVVLDRETGFLIKKDDYSSLKASVLKILNDSLLRRKLSQQSKQFARENLTLGIMLDKYEEVFRKALSLK